MTKTQDIFFPTAGAIKHVEYICKLGSVHTLQQVFVLHHLSNCIPVGHDLYIHAVHWAISLFVKVLGLASETRAFITS